MPKSTSVQKITAWSYSRWATYEECPLKAKLKFIDKLPEPPSPAMERGTLIHKMAEHYLIGRTTDLAPELSRFAGEFKDLKAQKPKCEANIAFTDKWAPTGWYDPDAWLRVKMDAEARVKGDPATLDVVDHKTGKNRGGYKNQLELYGLTGLLLYPTVKVVNAVLWFLDSGEVEPLTIKRTALAKLKATWEKRVQPMLSDERFSPKPGTACRWCAFKKANGGPCKFGV